jgi:hypothetical protein
VLPGVGVGVGGRAAALLGRFEVGLAASYWPSRTATLAAQPAAGGALRLLLVEARGCYAAPLGRVGLGPCVGLSAGRVSADGFGVRNPSSGAGAWLAPFVGGTAALVLHPRFALRFDLGVLVPALRPIFEIDRLGRVFRPSPVAGRAALGIEGRL